MELGLKDKIAFVAASSQGLGKQIALELSREQAIVIICARNPESLEKTRLEIRGQTGADLIAIAGDLSVASERERIIARTIQIYGKVDILVTNSGGPPSGRFESFTMEDWDKAYQQLLGSVVGLINGFL